MPDIVDLQLALAYQSAMSNQMRLVGFGASTAQGAADPEGGFLKRLQDLAEAGGFPVEVVNRGVGGNSLHHMLDRAQDLEKLRPYTLVVILGCNDLPRANDANPLQRRSLPEYRRDLEALLPAIKGGQRSLFITSYPVCPQRCGIDPGLFGQYMGVALEVARAQGYETWDLHAEICAKGTDYLSEDGLHYGAEGHAFIAEQVFAWVKSANAPSSSSPGKIAAS